MDQENLFMCQSILSLPSCFKPVEIKERTARKIVLTLNKQHTEAVV